MKNYIVRIYRQEKDNSRKIVGVVEEPELGEKRAFTNIDELWDIFNPEIRKISRRRKKNDKSCSEGKWKGQGKI